MNNDGDAFGRYRYLSGLSRGLVVLTIAAFFWIGVAAWGLRGDLWTFALSPLLAAAGAAAVGGWRLGKRARMLRSTEVKVSEATSVRRLTIWFRVISTLQTAVIILAGLLCSWIERPDLLWPLIGLVVSLHFIPLGWLPAGSTLPAMSLVRTRTRLSCTVVCPFSPRRRGQNHRPISAVKVSEQSQCSSQALFKPGP